VKLIDLNLKFHFLLFIDLPVAVRDDGRYGRSLAALLIDLDDGLNWSKIIKSKFAIIHQQFESALLIFILRVI
jgi:hypothetical protein